MNSTSPALIIAAAGVGLGHAIMPDHWVPLAVVGRTRRYPLRRVARLSGLAGVAHVLVSLLLGGVIIAIGLQFRSTIQHTQNTIVGLVLIATGVGFIVLELSGRGHDTVAIGRRTTTDTITAITTTTTSRRPACAAWRGSWSRSGPPPHPI